MGRDHLRLAVWALAIVTSFAIFGDDTAYAWNTQPRVMAGGLFFKDDPTNLPAGSDKVRFGVTGRCDILGTTTVGSSSTCVSPRGRFEYHNKFTGLKARGRITSLTFEPVLATDGCATDAVG